MNNMNLKHVRASKNQRITSRDIRLPKAFNLDKSYFTVTEHKSHRLQACLYLSLQPHHLTVVAMAKMVLI